MERVRAAQYFAEDYPQAREWFLEAAHAQGAELIHRELGGPRGRRGETLSTDIAWFGDPGASRVFVSLSGTHGQEFFAGAAGQLHWVTNGQGRSLPTDVAVCLVHAYNPWGASWNSRGNENFVDLNRNYFPPGTQVRPNELYSPLFDILSTSEMSEAVLDETMAAFYRFVEENDTRKALTAMGGGQNTHPSGILYCGAGDEASTQTLRWLVEERLSGVEKLALIDWHTGLGDYGALTVMMDEPVHSECYRWGCAWWGGPEAAEALQPKETDADSVGMVKAGMAAHLGEHGVTVASAVMEIGTVDNEAVLGALLIDRWLRFECDDIEAPEATRLRTMMMERLNPTLPSWRQRVLENTDQVYRKTVAGLENW